jgi:ribosomal-protein-alanine N-acetyltransferase
VHKMLLDIPTCIETERLYLRPYRAGDGAWYYGISLRNRAHLARYEAGNPALALSDPQSAEVLMREFAAHWVARSCFFMGVFDRASDEFVAQIYVGPIDWGLPEFEIGYFADVDHQGQGYVTEAVGGTLRFVFQHLGARRICLRCDDTNLRSALVAERSGLAREGHVRENKAHPDGSITGTLYYGMLRSEFGALSQSGIS